MNNPDSYINRTLDCARNSRNSGDYINAIKCMKKLVAAYPFEESYWLILGSDYEKLELLDQAIDCFKRAVQQNPLCDLAYAGLGRANMAKGSLDLADSAFRSAISIKPTAPRYILVGNIQRNLGHIDDARRSFLKAIELEPNNIEALGNAASTSSSGDPDYAETCLRKILSINPENAPALAELAYILSSIFGRHDEAERLCRLAINKDYNNIWYHVYLANILWSKCLLNDAEQEYLIACRVSNDNQDESTALSLLGDYYNKTSRRDDALRCLRKAMELSPGDSDIQKKYIQIENQ